MKKGGKEDGDWICVDTSPTNPANPSDPAYLAATTLVVVSAAGCVVRLECYWRSPAQGVSKSGSFAVTSPNGGVDGKDGKTARREVLHDTGTPKNSRQVRSSPCHARCLALVCQPPSPLHSPSILCNFRHIRFLSLEEGRINKPGVLGLGIMPYYEGLARYILR